MWQVCVKQIKKENRQLIDTDVTRWTIQSPSYTIQIADIRIVYHCFAVLGAFPFMFHPNVFFCFDCDSRCILSLWHPLSSTFPFRTTFSLAAHAILWQCVSGTPPSIIHTEQSSRKLSETNKIYALIMCVCLFAFVAAAVHTCRN